MRDPKSLRHRLTAGLGLATVAAVALGVLASSPAQAEGTVLNADSAAAVPGKYLVKLKESVSASSVGSAATALAKKYGGEVGATFDSSMHGFAAELSAAEARRLAADPRVEFVEQDQVVSLAATQANPPSWGLDRVDQRDLPLSDGYTYQNEAPGVHVYVIDTGINLSHATFGGRAVSGTDTIDGDTDATDCDGHGTHVAGTIGGSQYGVAKSVQLVGVRVLDCVGDGTTSSVVAGVEWVTDNAVKPAVANMSLRGPGSSSIDTAVAESIASGVTYAVAAGNDGAPACDYSPARLPAAITVGATTSTDAKPSYSNHGSCLDLFAPGSGITSSWVGSTTATNTIDGTSMATPHVAGAAALYLTANPGATPTQVRDAIVSNGTTGKVTNAGTGSPNVLLYTGFIGGTGADFSMSVSPVGGSLARGSSVTATVTTTTTAGSTQAVALSASGLPSGVTASFSPASVTSGGTSTVTFTASSTAATGAVSVTVKGTGASVARSAAYALSVTTADGGTGCTVTNGVAKPLADAATTTSTVAVSGCGRNGTTTSSVSVDIRHTFRGDLVIDLVAPDGTAYRVKASSTADGVDDVVATYTVNLSSEAGDGTWTLRVRDAYSGDTGTLNGWTLSL